MPDFLNGVRVVSLLAQTPGASAKPEDSAAVVVTDTNGKTVRVNHSSGDAFLAVPICAIVFTFIYLITKAIMAPFTQRAKDRRAMPQGNSGGLTPEEIAVLQKIQRTLSQMESRVEALETILIEQSRTEKNYGSKL